MCHAESPRRFNFLIKEDAHFHYHIYTDIKTIAGRFQLPSKYQRFSEVSICRAPSHKTTAVVCADLLYF